MAYIVMMKLSEFDIEKARKTKGWSQAEFAKKVGTTQSLISQYENKTGSPFKTYLRMLDKLGYKMAVVKK